jgi:inhibitor of KinA
MSRNFETRTSLYFPVIGSEVEESDGSAGSSCSGIPRLGSDDEEIDDMKVSALGDCALVVDFADESSDSDMLLRRALFAADALERARIPGVREIASAYQSVAVFLDLPCVEASVEEDIREIIHAAESHRHIAAHEIEIPVCYDSEFGLDSARVVRQTNLPIEQVIDLHSSTEFTVVCIGFMPGFPYLAGLPPQLSVPRLATPRTKVPAGSVAIANAQTGVYPFESPGGWNIIGRTPLRIFDPKRTPPAFLASGDRVRFRKINRETFDARSAPKKN